MSGNETIKGATRISLSEYISFIKDIEVTSRGPSGLKLEQTSRFFVEANLASMQRSFGTRPSPVPSSTGAGLASARGPRDKGTPPAPDMQLNFVEFVACVCRLGFGRANPLGVGHAKDGKALGLHWQKLTKKPASGEELVSIKLSTALQSKVEFTQAEWEALGVDLRTEHFVKAGAYQLGRADGGGGRGVQRGR